MKIGYFTNARHNSGVGRYAVDTARLTDSDLIHIDFNKNYLDDYYNMNIPLKFNISIFNYLNIIYYRQMVEKISNNYNLVHITSLIPPYIFSQKLNKVVTIHDIIPFKIKKNYSVYHQEMYKLFLKRYIKYKNIIVPSNYVKNDIINFFNVQESHLKVINPIVSDYFFHINDKKKLRLELNLPQNKYLILSISSDEQRKNLNMVNKVMEQLDSRFKLIRIGPPLNNSITFSNVDNIAVNKIYNACDVLFFPTLEEGFGSPVVEAFKTGLPVVASNIDVIREISKEAALLVNPLDLNENVKAIKTVIENAPYYVEKGLNVIKFYEKDYIKTTLINYYTSILS